MCDKNYYMQNLLSGSLFEMRKYSDLKVDHKYDHMIINEKMVLINIKKNMLMLMTYINRR